MKQLTSLDWCTLFSRIVAVQISFLAFYANCMQKKRICQKQGTSKKYFKKTFTKAIVASVKIHFVEVPIVVILAIQFLIFPIQLAFHEPKSKINCFNEIIKKNFKKTFNCCASSNRWFSVCFAAFWMLIARSLSASAMFPS